MSNRLEESVEDDLEYISVEELYEEELEALSTQHSYLMEKNTEDSLRAAESLVHVIAYFRVRLGLEDTDLSDVYGAAPDETLH